MTKTNLGFLGLVEEPTFLEVTCHEKTLEDVCACFTENAGYFDFYMTREQNVNGRQKDQCQR